MEVTSKKPSNLTAKKKRSPKTTKRRHGTQLEADLSWHPVFLKTFATSGNILHSCKAAKITRPTFYDHCRKYPEFQAAVDVAREDAIDVLEKEARKRGLSTSDTLLIFLLKSLRPEVYRETINNKHSGSLTVDVSKLTDEELRAIAQA